MYAEILKASPESGASTFTRAEVNAAALGLAQVEGGGMLFWIHPIAQCLTILPALYVLWLGAARFASRHLGRKTSFKRRRHAMLGKVVVLMWAFGGLVGLAYTYHRFGKVFTASPHFRIGIAILVLLAATWWTGTRLDRNRRPSHLLPVMHLINNVVLLFLVGLQLISGIDIVHQALAP